MLFGLSSFFSDSQKICSIQHKITIGEEEEEEEEEEVKNLCYVVGGGLPEPTSVLDDLRSPSSTTTTLSSATVTAGDDKCSRNGYDDLDGVLSSGQEQSTLRLIMDSSSGFGVFDPGFVFGSNPLLPCSFPFQEQTNPEAMIYPNHSLFSDPPLSPPAKRFNSGSLQPVFNFSDPDPGHNPFQFHQQQIPCSSTSLVPIPPQRMAGDDKSVIIEQLFNAAELITTTGNQNGDNTVLAQGILARLNHYINSNKTPFQRAASQITEALLSLIHDSSSPPENNLILRIAAYKTFSETSPFLQFVNFTSNQTILDSYHDESIHIIDFDIGFGGKWSSLMQELSSRKTSLKITVFTPPPSTISDDFELRFTEENLKTFAGEVEIPFEIEILSLELLLNPSYWPLSLRSSEKETIAVNLPLSSVVSPLILRFLKQISPNVVVCINKAYDIPNAPFPNAVIHALQYQTALLESLDQSQSDSSIERFWIQREIEKVLMKRHRWIEKSLQWRSLFTQCGFSPVSLSQTAEIQAECLLRRNPVRGFHVERRECSSLVLCWQRKELVTVSAWKC